MNEVEVLHDDPFPGSAADFYERIQVLKAEIEQLKELVKYDAFLREKYRAMITDLEEFVLACRYAGPDGLDRLKEEATRLYQRAREATK